MQGLLLQLGLKFVWYIWWVGKWNMPVKVCKFDITSLFKQRLWYCAVLLFFYLSYKLGICQCICHGICRSIWACFATCFSMLECCCTFLCFKLQKHNYRRRRRRGQDIEELAISSDEEDCEGNISSRGKSEIETEGRRRRLRSHRGKENKEEYLRRALRPKSHRTLIRLSSGDSFVFKKKNSRKNDDHHISPLQHIRVTKSCKLSQKGGSFFKASMSHRRRRWECKWDLVFTVYIIQKTYNSFGLCAW